MPDRETFYKRKLSETRQELTRLRKANRLWARENYRLQHRFYQDERTIQQLRKRARARD